MDLSNRPNYRPVHLGLEEANVIFDKYFNNLEH